MPVYARDKNGKVLNFDSEREARLFGTTPISEQEATGITRPDFGSLVNPATGKLQDRFNLGPSESLTDYAGGQLKDINLNTQGLDEIRRRALETGPSKWEQLALGKQGVEEAGALDEATRAGKGAEAGALSNLAMFGGVSGGERERIGYGSARDIAESRQRVGQEGRGARAGIGLAAEEQKLGLLKGLPGQEVEALNPAFRKAELMGQAKQTDIGNKSAMDRFNLSNLIKDTSEKNLFDMTNYQEQMKKYGAEQEAKATANSGGTHICTAVHREYTIDEGKLEQLDSFRDAAMEYFPEVFKFYLTKCEDLIPRMKAAGADIGMLRPFVNLVFLYIDKFGVEYALDFYADYTQELIKLYMPEIFDESERIRRITASN